MLRYIASFDMPLDDSIGSLSWIRIPSSLDLTPWRGGVAVSRRHAGWKGLRVPVK